MDSCEQVARCVSQRIPSIPGAGALAARLRVSHGSPEFKVTNQGELLFHGIMTKSTQFDDHVRQVQAGDLDAFAAIVRQFERSVRAWVVSRCPPGGDADEVAQKTFFEVFRRIDDYEPGTDFRAWLFTIARFQLMAECTRLKRLADYHSRFVPVALDRELERRAGESAVLENDRLGCLQACLEAVEGPARQILDWRYSEECPLSDIANRTNRSIGAIKKQLFLLRQKLHECVERKLRAEGL